MPDPIHRRAAYCDVDGTLAHTTIVTPLVWMKRRQLGRWGRSLWLASLLMRGPWWLLLDRFSRDASNNSIYAQYRGSPVEETNELAETCYRECLKPRLFLKALAQLGEYRLNGVSVVLVTGGLDLFMKPMAEDLGVEWIAPALEENGAVYSGRLTTPPLAGKRKAEAIHAHAAKHRIVLAHSFALGDAFGDLPMLETVGHPIAVNPDRRLRKVATSRGWPIHAWRD